MATNTTNGWIPTHAGTIDDPMFRDWTCGVKKKYIPFFSDESEARAWCRAVDAVPAECCLGVARNIAENGNADLEVCG